MHAASGGHAHFEKKKFTVVRTFEWCLCLQLENKVKMEAIIVFMRNHWLAFWKKVMFLWWRVVKFYENFSRKQKLQFLLLCNAYNYNINLPIPLQHMEFRCLNKLFCLWKLWIDNLKEKRAFRWNQFRGFDGDFVRIKDRYSKLRRLHCTT